jgi:hypothetical protein
MVHCDAGHLPVAQLVSSHSYESMTMNDMNSKTDSQKLEWATPELINLGADLHDVQSNSNPGNDGAGGLTTSLAS